MGGRYFGMCLSFICLYLCQYVLLCIGLAVGVCVCVGLNDNEKCINCM